MFTFIFFFLAVFLQAGAYGLTFLLPRLFERFGRLKDQLGYGVNYVFHSFRKGFATQLENANIPVNVSARLMGHEVSGETFGRYSNGLAFQGLKEAIEHIDWRST